MHGYISKNIVVHHKYGNLYEHSGHNCEVLNSFMSQFLQFRNDKLGNIEEKLNR